MEILKRRWNRIVAESDVKKKRVLFKESASATLEAIHDPLPGPDTFHFSGSFLHQKGPFPNPVRVGYRSFDRQWIIPDSRLMHRPRRPLWPSRIPGQVFVVEQHSKQIRNGPGIVFSGLIPDMHYFKGSEGGRVLPFLYPDGTPNFAPGLVQGLSSVLGLEVPPSDLLAYLAGIISHPAYERKFADELVTPGIRVPITSDPELWNEAVRIGREIVWIHTYGDAFADASKGRPKGNIRFVQGDSRQPLMRSPMTTMPEPISYDTTAETLEIGDSKWSPVLPGVWEYAVDGKEIIKSWFNYRRANPGGSKVSPLDHEHLDGWPSSWSTELIDLLTALTRLVGYEPSQADLLDRVVEGELATRDSLTALGVRWPHSSKDRLPHFPVTPEGPEHLPPETSNAQTQ